MSSCVAEVFAIFGTSGSFISAGVIGWSLPVGKVLKPKSLRFSLQNTSLFKILSQFFEQQQGFFVKLLFKMHLAFFMRSVGSFTAKMLEIKSLKYMNFKYKIVRQIVSKLWEV